MGPEDLHDTPRGYGDPPGQRPGRPTVSRVRKNHFLIETDKSAFYLPQTRRRLLDSRSAFTVR